MTVDDSPRPGLSAERVGMFTDAIFAIAITLLALEIPRPEEPEQLADLGHFLSEHSGAFAGFALAFLMLWFNWRAHHTLFDQLARVSQTVLAVHIPLLLFSAFLPYTTGLLYSGSLPPDARSIALAMFGGTEAVLMLCQGLLYTLTLKQGLYAVGANTARMGTAAAINWGIGILWALSAMLASPLGDNTTLLWLATPLVVVAILYGMRVWRGREGERASLHGGTP
ncbi:TMEM175 family protein [Nonomuraea sp. NPDC049152]|uniref:TMEM175 family protein n=1 Tax=Nonomuraea sp. NPDC049152 TaxID=3154350 RepID=UPI0033C16F12